MIIGIETKSKMMKKIDGFLIIIISLIVTQNFVIKWQTYSLIFNTGSWIVVKFFHLSAKKSVRIHNTENAFHNPPVWGFTYFICRFTGQRSMAEHIPNSCIASLWLWTLISNVFDRLRVIFSPAPAPLKSRYRLSINKKNLFIYL